MNAAIVKLKIMEENLDDPGESEVSQGISIVVNLTYDASNFGLKPTYLILV